jgi:hypothetical protein
MQHKHYRQRASEQALLHSRGREGRRAIPPAATGWDLTDGIESSVHTLCPGRKASWMWRPRADVWCQSGGIHAVVTAQGIWHTSGSAAVLALIGGAW